MTTMQKNILIITQEYPADDLEKEFTPVVHFFTKEWVKQGYNVLVLNFPSNFPIVYYWGAKFFRRKIESRLGINIRTYWLSNREYELDGVKVARIPLRKMKPHGRFPQGQLANGIKQSIDFCNKNNFKPNVIIGHWTNPTVDIMLGLKQVYNVPCALSMHDGGFDFKSIYKDEKEAIFSKIDCWGYRSYPIKREFEACFGIMPKSYMCFSGVPSEYVRGNEERVFNGVSRFLFVGLLLKRKHPFEFVKALDDSDIKDYSLDIVGQGDESVAIKQYIQKNPCLQSKVHLCGRIPRDEVSKKMRLADVFCMISKSEAFGLVYIEAMAAGCITIASRNEGFDGIIKDGENGFLCEAGNVEELTTIINKISLMNSEALKRVSENAVATAQKMTDEKVAESYIKDIERLLSL